MGRSQSDLGLSPARDGCLRARGLYTQTGRSHALVHAIRKWQTPGPRGHQGAQKCIARCGGVDHVDPGCGVVGHRVTVRSDGACAAQGQHHGKARGAEQEDEQRRTGNAVLDDFPRQALHAFRLGLLHPQTGVAMEWTAPMAADLAALLDELRSRRTGGRP